MVWVGSVEAREAMEFRYTAGLNLGYLSVTDLNARIFPSRKILRICPNGANPGTSALIYLKKVRRQAKNISTLSFRGNKTLPTQLILIYTHTTKPFLLSCMDEPSLTIMAMRSFCSFRNNSKGDCYLSITRSCSYKCLL